MRVRDVLLRRHLCSLGVAESDRGRVRLEAADGARFAGLADDVDGLADADGGREELVGFVGEGDEEALFVKEES
jgi:hypothetical protein